MVISLAYIGKKGGKGGKIFVAVINPKFSTP
jgi:hypothetical protein